LSEDYSKTETKKEQRPKTARASTKKKNAHFEESPHLGSKTPRMSGSKSQLVLDIGDGDPKKKDKEKRLQPKGKVNMPSKPVQEWTVSDVQEWLMHISTQRPKSKEKKKEVPIVPFYEEYGGQFESHKIDGPKLLLQTRMTLANDLLIKNQYRAILMEFVDELKEQGQSVNPTPSPRPSLKATDKARPSQQGLAVSVPTPPEISRTSPAASAPSSPNAESQPVFFSEEEEPWVAEVQQTHQQNQSRTSAKTKKVKSKVNVEEEESINEEKEKLEQEKMRMKQEKLETEKQRLLIKQEKEQLKLIQQQQKRNGRIEKKRARHTYRRKTKIEC